MHKLYHVLATFSMNSET